MPTNLKGLNSSYKIITVDQQNKTKTNKTKQTGHSAYLANVCSSSPKNDYSGCLDRGIKVVAFCKVFFWLYFLLLHKAGLKPCQKERLASLAWSGSASPGRFVAQCKNDGEFKPVQCTPSGDFCWCVDENGKPIPRTRSTGKIFCTDKGL